MNKPNGYTMTSYDNNERSKNIKNTKTEPTIYMVILVIVANILIITKAITLMIIVTKIVITIKQDQWK